MATTSTDTLDAIETDTIDEATANAIDADVVDTDTIDADVVEGVEASVVDVANDVDDKDDHDDDQEWERGPIVAGGVFVGRSAIHGTGVFASRSFEADEVIEQCPVLVVPPDHATRVSTTTLGDYVYEWEGGYAVALGFGSLYNHSRTPAARYEMAYDLEEIHVVAVRPIEADEEITINYNGDPDDQSPVWFEPDA